MSVRDYTAPTRCYAGTGNDVVVLPKGSYVEELQFVGGSVAGFPNGNGTGTITITAPAAGFNYLPRDLTCPQQHADGSLTFAGTSSYFVKVYSPGGF